MHAAAVENLLPFITPSEAHPAPRVLDIGSGSGYLTHVMAQLVGDNEGATVVGIEHIKPLAELGERNMRKSEDGREMLNSGKVKFVVGDGRKGWKDPEDEAVQGVGQGEGRKWDAIHVGAAAAEMHPELLEQLGSPGRMFIPVDDDVSGWGQHIWCVDKDGEGKVTQRKLFGVRYVPLTDAPK